jgi:hypothetical protein
MRHIFVANGEKIKIVGHGSISIFSKIINNVLHVEGYTSNLLSISKILKLFSYKNMSFFRKPYPKR